VGQAGKAGQNSKCTNFMWIRFSVGEQVALEVVFHGKSCLAFLKVAPATPSSAAGPVECTGSIEAVSWGRKWAVKHDIYEVPGNHCHVYLPMWSGTVMS